LTGTKSAFFAISAKVSTTFFGILFRLGLSCKASMSVSFRKLNGLGQGFTKL